MSPTFDDMGAAPTSLEAPPPGPPPPPKRSEAAGPVKKGGSTAASHESVNYTSAAERCETCEHFDEEGSQCNLHQFEAEPGGHCDDFELLGAGEGETELPGGEEEPDLAIAGGDEEDLEEEY